MNTFDSFYMLLITIGLDTSSSKLENFLLHYFNTKQYSIFKLAAILKGSSIYFGSSNLFEREFWFNIILTLFGLSLKIVYVTANIFVTNTVCTAQLYQWYVWIVIHKWHSNTITESSGSAFRQFLKHHLTFHCKYSLRRLVGQSFTPYMFIKFISTISPINI